MRPELEQQTTRYRDSNCGTFQVSQEVLMLRLFVLLVNDCRLSKTFSILAE